MFRLLTRSLLPSAAPKLAAASGIARRTFVPLASFSSQNPKLVLHCTFTKNNTLLTLSRRVPKKEQVAMEEGVLDQEALIDAVRPAQEVIVTVTCGQLGFKGARKDTFDAAFQTVSKMFAFIEKRGLTNEDLELVFRNFGQNRQAFFKVLLGKEGANIRPMVKRVTDGTRIKFGGDRSPNRRRI